MRVMEVSGTGFENLKLVDRPFPAPGPGEVQVRMKAATLNYRDALMLESPGRAGRMPYVPLSCGCGEVLAVGDGVTRVGVRDRVCPTFFQRWTSGAAEAADFGTALGGPVDGVAREIACFPQDSVVRIPDSLSDLEAATLPCAGLTAWNGLFAIRAARPGDVVLLQGTGGVSIAGLQFAKAAGATVIITSSSDRKLARARSLGADFGINYQAQRGWDERAREITIRMGREPGVDLVLEVGGAGTLPQSMNALREGGVIAAIGLLTGSPIQVDNVQAPGRAGGEIHRIRVGNRDQFEEMLRGIEANSLRPVVDRVFPLEKLGEALRALRAGAMFGKIGITFE